ncbi:invasion associated locus B family protein [Muricoccus nepalensis]|uniref:invasion associated locus B family protein n=1 Tax=Muricoccus nepalensis TaxID=1854500 RepID=UPI0013869EA0|nr:invasion associated locus B family protein [Roseomonas nepalensis]
MIRPIPVLAALLLVAPALRPAPALAQARQGAAAEPRAGAATPAQAPATNTPAANTPAAGPQRLGTFGEWTAATHSENGGKVCYAFTRPDGNANALLTVTHRPQGRDQVALRVGRAFPRNAEVTVEVNGKELNFYTAGDNAFARDGRATVSAFRNGREAEAKSPAANNRSTTETFSLQGFSAAYDAISRECPAAAPSRPRR